MPTFWFVLPSLPMFLAIPILLNRGMGFWPALAIGCGMTIVLYLIMVWALGAFGICCRRQWMAKAAPTPADRRHQDAME